MNKDKIYDVIIIGGGAAGLFCAAAYSRQVEGLILEKTGFTCKKLLMSGGGQCNVSHGGDIKEFIKHYGDNGKRIRTVLYKFNNTQVCDFFENNGVSMFEREDGKIFPKSLDAKDVASVLRKESGKNGFSTMYGCSVFKIESENDFYSVMCKNKDTEEERCFRCRKIVVASGGCSYPSTGSDGSMFQVLSDMGLKIVTPSPALVPISVEDYPYEQLAGISFSPAEVTLEGKGKKNCDDLLFTHKNFSGPAVINISRYIKDGDRISINYFPGKSTQEMQEEIRHGVIGSSKQIVTFMSEYLGQSVPKRFIEAVCRRAGAEPSQKASALKGAQLKTIAEFITRDRFSVTKTGGFDVAMATCGGVDLEEINLKTMECKKYKNLFVIGEALDVDGDTGGYNLQFAFSGGYLAGQV